MGKKPWKWCGSTSLTCWSPTSGCPDADGLEMIARAKQLREDLDFVIISGYRHFEYAQSAIKYGVSDYLLKPIQKEELCSTLEKMRRRYQMRTEQLSNEERLRMRLQSDIDKLRCGLFNHLLSADANSPLSLEQVNRDYHFQFAPGLFQIFIAKVDCPLSRDSVKVLEEKVLHTLCGTLRPVCTDMEACFTGSRAYGILNYPEECRATVRKRVLSAMDELLVQTGLFENTQLTIGLGTAVDHPGRLEDSLQSAEAAVVQRLLDGTGKVIEKVPQEGAFNEDRLLSTVTCEIESAVEVLDRDALSAALKRFQKDALAAPGINGSTCCPWPKKPAGSISWCCANTRSMWKIWMRSTSAFPRKVRPAAAHRNSSGISPASSASPWTPFSRTAAKRKNGRCALPNNTYRNTIWSRSAWRRLRILSVSMPLISAPCLRRRAGRTSWNTSPKCV